MAYTLEFEQEGRVIVADVTGDRSAPDSGESASSTWETLLRVCAEKTCDRMLIRGNITGEDRKATVNDYTIGSSLEKWGMKPGWKVAFVNQSGEPYPNLEFAETVARNRGHEIRVFSDESAARGWLVPCPEPETDGVKWVSSRAPET